MQGAMMRAARILVLPAAGVTGVLLFAVAGCNPSEPDPPRRPSVPPDAPQQNQPEPPAELQRAWDYRCSPRTAHLEWVIRCSGSDCDSAEQFLTTRISGRRWAVINHGDRTGLQKRNPDGSPGAYAPDMELGDEQTSEVWVNDLDSRCLLHFHPPTLTEWRWIAGLPYDVRLLGFAWAFEEGQIWDRVRAPEAVERYTVKTEPDGLCAVTAVDAAYGHITWWLDPSKAWQPVRTVQEALRGLVPAVSTTAYAVTDGYWSPVSMKCSFSGASVSGKMELSIDVIYASYDHPAHHEVGPADIAMLPGMVVAEFSHGMPWDSRYWKDWRDADVWDGSAHVSRQEWNRKLKAGLVDDGEFKRYSAWLDADRHGKFLKCPPCRGPCFWMLPETDAPRNPELWEAVVRAFVIEHGLHRAEATKVWSLCEDCEAEAFAYLDQHKAEIEQIRRQLRGATPSQAEQLNLRLDRLHASVEAIFREKLKPSLKLPVSEPGPGNESSTATDTKPASSLPSS